MGVNAYTDLEAMLDKEKPDVGLITVQPEIHHAVARVLAEKKVHILTETPIALTVPCADAMIQATAENGVFLEVSENVRRWPHERVKRKIVERGLIGEVRAFYLSYTSGSYHGVSAVRAILGTEARGVTGEFPDREEIRERGMIEWSGGIRGNIRIQYEAEELLGDYWDRGGHSGERTAPV